MPGNSLGRLQCPTARHGGIGRAIMRCGPQAVSIRSRHDRSRRRTLPRMRFARTRNPVRVSDAGAHGARGAGRSRARRLLHRRRLTPVEMPRVRPPLRQDTRLAARTPPVRRTATGAARALALAAPKARVRRTATDAASAHALAAPNGTGATRGCGRCMDGARLIGNAARAATITARRSPGRPEHHPARRSDADAASSRPRCPRHHGCGTRGVSVSTHSTRAARSCSSSDSERPCASSHSAAPPCSACRFSRKRCMVSAVTARMPVLACGSPS